MAKHCSGSKTEGPPQRACLHCSGCREAFESPLAKTCKADVPAGRQSYQPMPRRQCRSTGRDVPVNIHNITANRIRWEDIFQISSSRPKQITWDQIAASGSKRISWDDVTGVCSDSETSSSLSLSASSTCESSTAEEECSDSGSSSIAGTCSDEMLLDSRISYGNSINSISEMQSLSTPPERESSTAVGVAPDPSKVQNRRMECSHQRSNSCESVSHLHSCDNTSVLDPPKEMGMNGLSKNGLTTSTTGPTTSTTGHTENSCTFAGSQSSCSDAIHCSFRHSYHPLRPIGRQEPNSDQFDVEVCHSAPPDASPNGLNGKRKNSMKRYKDLVKSQGFTPQEGEPRQDTPPVYLQL